MEKTSILDFISKLTGANSDREADEKTTLQDGSSDQTTENRQKENAQSQSKSFMKSYNPFSAAESDKRQISSPRAVKPPKSTIDLKNGKNLAGEKKNDGSSDMVRLINRHNALAKRIDCKKGD